MVIMNGKGVCGGVAFGPVCFYRRAERDVERREIRDVQAELERVAAARQEADRQLGILHDRALKEIGEKESLLFEIHQMMLEDLDYTEAIEGMIQNEKVNAEFAVQSAANQFAQMFAEMEDSYMQARAADVRDVSKRLIDVLCGVEQGGIQTDRPVIVAADDLAPSETVQLDKSKILAFITRGGSVNSHTAILARTMGIPAIIGVGDALKIEFDGRQAVLNGTTGEMIVEPDEEIIIRLRAVQAKEAEHKHLLEELKGQPSVTRDGQEMLLYANIGSPEDVDAVLQNDAGGIGLFRSEFLYLENDDYPTEEQLFEVYKTVAERMDGKRVIIRTLDIGADKQAGYFNLPHEENPAMGMRAIRICLARQEVFKTQLRAIYRASAYGKIAIMFPMIASLWEVRESKRIAAEVRESLKAEGVPYAEDTEVGIMVETPAAAILSDLFAKEVDFFSVGTNDLTQYTLAVDRQNNSLERFYDPHHPAVLRLIRLIAENAHKSGIWMGICGELGADLALTETFLAMGVDELSVSPSCVLPLRQIIRDTNVEKIRDGLLDGLGK